jgi:hypothetical protein
MVTRYQKRTSEAGLKVSGPLLDRIDIHEVPRVPASREKLTGERVGESSSLGLCAVVSVPLPHARSHALFWGDISIPVRL